MSSIPRFFCSLAVICMLARPGFSQETLGWIVRAPARASQAAMVFDEARDVAVLFGGSFGSTSANAYGRITWLWTGRTWIQGPIAGPSERSTHAMAYDSERKKVVLFGGRNGLTLLGDTWEFDGTTWTQRTVSGPSPRASISMAYDSVRRKCVIYGGTISTGRSTETWEWDGDAWTMVANAGPPAASGVSLAFDPVRNQTVAYGFGPDPSATWVWDGQTWRRVNASGPGGFATQAQTMVYSPSMERVLLFGQGSRRNELWKWDGNSWQLDSVVPFENRNSVAMCFDPRRSQLLLFGGAADRANRSDLWSMDGEGWRALSRPPLHNDGGVYLADDLKRKTMCAIYSRGYDANPAGIPYAIGSDWNGLVWRCGSLDPVVGQFVNGWSGGPTLGATVNFDPISEKVLTIAYPLAPIDSPAATFGWNGENWTRLGDSPTLEPKEALANRAAVIPSYGGIAFLGSYSTTFGFLDRVRVWDGQAWTVIPANEPLPELTGSTVVCNPDGSSLLMLDRSLGTFAFVGNAWEQLLSRPPSATAMYDARFDAISSFSPGASSVSVWSGTSWESRSVLPSRFGFSETATAAFDSTRAVVTAWVPLSPGFNGTVLELASLPFVLVPPEREVVLRNGQDLLLEVDAAGSGDLAYEWFRDGEPLRPADRYGPLHSRRLELRDIQRTDSGVFSVVVTDASGGQRTLSSAVQVFCIADFNMDGFLDFTDFDQFVEAITSGARSADVNNDQFLTFDDIDAFIEAFQAGC